jgi:Co/Zn/Cd efflux system component
VASRRNHGLDLVAATRSILAKSIELPGCFAMSACCNDGCASPPSAPRPDGSYRLILWIALSVNLAMFVVEIVASLASRSMSLRADALDFLGDAANYALALAVFGMALRWRAATALAKGVVMGVFGLWVATSTVSSAVSEVVPKAEIMGAIGMIALAANVTVAALLYRYRQSDSQALSVWLCTRNDVFVNLAVIAAGAGVWASGTRWPDIAVAAVVALLGLSAATRIIRKALGEMRSSPGAAVAAE